MKKGKFFLILLALFGIVLVVEGGVAGATLGTINIVEKVSSLSNNQSQEEPETTPEETVEPEPEEFLPINIDPVRNKFECEDMTLIGAAMKGEQRGADTNNPSGGSLVSELNNNIGSGVSFNVKSDLDSIADFIVCIGRRSDKTIDFKVSFTLVVNGYEQSIRSVSTTKCEADVNYFGWAEYSIAYIGIKKGVNTISFVTKGSTASNLDYFILDTYANLSMVTNEA